MRRHWTITFLSCYPQRPVPASQVFPLWTQNLAVCAVPVQGQGGNFMQLFRGVRLDSASGSWRWNCVRKTKPSFLWALQEETRPIDQFLLHNVSEVWDQMQVGELLSWVPLRGSQITSGSLAANFSVSVSSIQTSLLSVIWLFLHSSNSKMELAFDFYF